MSRWIINTIVIVVLIIVFTGLGWLANEADERMDEKRLEKEAEIYFNGTMYGRFMTIQNICENNVIPFFNETGDVLYLQVPGLCDYLNSVQLNQEVK